ncbi:hypothetical protein [Nostoc sp.]|uniref:hypothetical protein n=1 Tax=Nostoc sp. TaxID=1180 RepID=UPI002FF9FA00
MTENKDSKNPIAQDNTTNELSEKDIASVSGGNFIPPNKTTSFPKTPNGLSEHELGSVSGGATRTVDEGADPGTQGGTGTGGTTGTT